MEFYVARYRVFSIVLSCVTVSIDTLATAAGLADNMYGYNFASVAFGFNSSVCLFNPTSIHLLYNIFHPTFYASVRQFKDVKRLEIVNWLFSEDCGFVSGNDVKQKLSFFLKIIFFLFFILTWFTLTLLLNGYTNLKKY